MSLRNVVVRGILGCLNKPLARRRGTPGVALLGLIFVLAVGAPAAAVDCLDVYCPDSGGGCGCGGDPGPVFPSPEPALDVTLNPLTAQSTHHTTAVEQTGWGASVTVTLTQWDSESFLWNFHLGQSQSLQALPNGMVGVVQPDDHYAADEQDGFTDEELESTEVTLGECPPGTGDDDDDDDGGGGGDDNGDDIGGDDNGDDNGGACPIPDDTDEIGTDPALPPDEEPIEDVVADPNDEEESPESWDGTGESEADYDPDAPFETDPDQDDDALSLLAGSRESAPGELVAIASIRSATDAAGRSVAATLDSGGFFNVFHQRGGYAYPVVVRVSLVEDGDLVTNEASSEASFSAAETCTERNRAKIVTWNPRGWGKLARAFSEYPATCSRYYITIPPVDGDKTMPRSTPHLVHAHNLRPKPPARNARFVAMAEFHWSAWGMSTPNPNPGPYEAGRQFRRRMFQAGYRAENGDGWVVQELPSAVRRDPVYRKRVVRLLKGLYEGDPIEGPPEVRQKAPGVVLMANFGHRAPRLGVYKANLEEMSKETAFWNAVDKYTTFWAQETYTDCIKACEPRRTVNAKAKRVNAFIQHPARLVFAPNAPLGNPSVRRVRQYFDSSYMSLMNGFWRADLYRTASFPLDRMSRLVGLQVYAARAWKQTHPYPDKRVGFAWNDNAGITKGMDPDKRARQIKNIRALANRTARAIEGAFSLGGTARRACRVAPGCNPVHPDGVFTELYETFARW